MAKSPLQHSHHIVPTFTYVKTLVALTILMLLTIFASYWNAPGGVVVNNLIALGIACLKAFLVIWVFMGIRWSTKLARLWAVAGFVTLPLMFIMFQDYFVRHNEVVPSWDGRPDSALPRVIDPVGQSKQVEPVDRGLRPRG
jgi:caa(3)-type oxidase subunit IV